MALLKHFSPLVRSNLRSINVKCSARLLSTDSSEEKPVDAKQGYAQAFEKFESLKHTENKEPKQTFASLLRNSKLIDVSFVLYQEWYVNKMF